MKNNNISKSLPGVPRVFHIFTVIGLAVMLGGFWHSYRSYKFAQTGIKTDGRITDITITGSGDDTKHNVFITYKIASGREYQTRGNFYHSGMRVGDTVAMRYNPDDARDARMVSGDIFISIFLPCFGLIFFLVGFVPFIRNMRRKKEALRLFETGVRLEAKIEKIYQNTSLKVNGKSPYRISAAMPGDGENKTPAVFSSGDLWFDPGLYVKPGDAIDVYVSAENPKKYFVDISPLYLLSKQKRRVAR